MDTENICPACGDEYDEQASQCRRVWSDYHDNIVCVTCKETAPVTDTDPTPPHGTPRPVLTHQDDPHPDTLDQYLDDWHKNRRADLTDRRARAIDHARDWLEEITDHNDSWADARAFATIWQALDLLEQTTAASVVEQTADALADKWTETAAEGVTLSSDPRLGCLFCQIAGRPFTPSRFSMTWAGNAVEVCTDCIGGALEARRQAETPTPPHYCPYCAQTVARDDWDSRGFCVWCYDSGQVPCVECHELGRMLDEESRCFACVYHPEHYTLD